MQLLIVNPNTTNSMTEAIGQAAASVALPDTQVKAVNPSHGPASIQGYYDEALCVPHLLEEITAHPDAGGIVIACFDDTGLDAARCLTDRPVVGIGEAAYHMASMLANRFSVITTLSRSVPALEHNLLRYGLAARCAKVRASEIPVLELENPLSNARETISQEIEKAKHEDHAEAIVLGCAGMTTFANELSSKHGLPVLDGVVCAVGLVESMVRLGMTTTRLGGYSPVESSV